MRTSTLACAIVAALLLGFEANAQQPGSRRPAVPVMTNEDASSPRASHSVPDETITPAGTGASPLRNPSRVLDGALSKMSEITSVRTRIQTSLPAGEREVNIETMKPDRVHLISADSEIIVIGRKFYLKEGESWQVTSMPAGRAQSDLGPDFRTLVKQLTAKTGVRITGQIVGSQMLDGVDTVAYEFVITDGSDRGTVEVCVGKEDGFMRRIFMLWGGMGVKIWFTNINEPLSIEAPM